MPELEQEIADVLREAERDKDPEYWKGLYLGMVALENERKIKEAEREGNEAERERRGAERKRKRGIWKEAVLLVALGAVGMLLLKAFVL
jgi:hypothetical protein